VNISGDTVIFWQYGPILLNATIVFTWVIMGLLLLVVFLVNRSLAQGRKASRRRHLLETLLAFLMLQIREVMGREPRGFLPFPATLFFFIATANVLAVVPGFIPPTGSLSTTTALALTVLVAVPFFGIRDSGIRAYCANYLRPTPLMLPFNIIGELSRTLALAVRLFGNVMSGTMIAAILIVIAPMVLPVLAQLMGILLGLVQAYIFTILATVYIGAGLQLTEGNAKNRNNEHREPRSRNL